MKYKVICIRESKVWTFESRGEASNFAVNHRAQTGHVVTEDSDNSVSVFEINESFSRTKTIVTYADLSRLAKRNLESTNVLFKSQVRIEKIDL